MRQTTQRGIDLIKHFEGFEPHVYLDAVGIPTIGYGHVVLEGEDFARGLSHRDAELLLQKDLRKFELAVLRLAKVKLTDGQFDALVSFAFNLGAGALQRSTLLKRLNSGMIDEAANQFPKWVYAGGRKLTGLVHRRNAERELFLS